MFSKLEVNLHSLLLTQLITDIDRAITDNKFNFFINFYTENGTLVITENLNISGKPELKSIYVNC
ncbi:hypothetical protein M997_2591 [Proteus hauseri ATCC 700826]|uniref:Uncharacterized protein n=1 Tax=Proteus hauseri ATCC 700826 TaxID=1354271 RepID=A0AAJ3HRQ4_PROHU|nr:hypothetical protein M997_2591 [Proteus hauseri ATCC 700826]